MSAVAIATFRCNSEGKAALTDFLSGDDGLSVTRAYDGAMRIETLLSNDNDDCLLYTSDAADE